MRHLILLCLPLLFLSACAKETTPATAAQDSIGAYVVPAASSSAARAAAKNAKVVCEKSQRCSLSVGMLTFTNGGASWGECTATLVAPGIVLTNGHCIPDDLQKPGSPCDGRIWLNFVAASGYESQLSCSRVLIANHDEKDRQKPDYAFIAMNGNKSRPSISISRLGLEDEILFTVEKVDPLKGNPKIQGVQKVTQCKAVQHNYIGPLFTSNLSTLGLLADCEFVHGNSGSSVVGPDNTVRAVLFTTITGKLNSDEKFEPTAPQAKAGDVTNFACLPIPANIKVSPQPADCALPNPPNKSDQAYSKAITDQLNVSGARHRSEDLGFDLFRWGWAFKDVNGIRFTPRCLIQKPSSYPATYLTSPLDFSYKMILDQYHRVQSVRITERKFSVENEVLNILTIEPGNSSDTFKVKIDAQTDVKEYEIPLCQ